MKKKKEKELQRFTVCYSEVVSYYYRTQIEPKQIDVMCYSIEKVIPGFNYCMRYLLNRIKIKAIYSHHKEGGIHRVYDPNLNVIKEYAK